MLYLLSSSTGADEPVILATLTGEVAITLKEVLK